MCIRSNNLEIVFPCLKFTFRLSELFPMHVSSAYYHNMLFSNTVLLNWRERQMVTHFMIFLSMVFHTPWTECCISVGEESVCLLFGIYSPETKKKKKEQKKFGFITMVTKKAIKRFLLEFNSWSMRFMFAYISLSRQGRAAGVLWGNTQHRNGTCAHKVITYYPTRAQKRCGLQSHSCSDTTARSGIRFLQGLG